MRRKPYSPPSGKLVPEVLAYARAPNDRAELPNDRPQRVGERSIVRKCLTQCDQVILDMPTVRSEWESGERPYQLTYGVRRPLGIRHLQQPATLEFLLDSRR